MIGGNGVKEPMQDRPAATREDTLSVGEATRRQLLRWLVGGVLGMFAVLGARMSERFLTPPLTTPRLAPVTFSLADAPAQGGSVYIAKARAYLIQDAGGYFALSAVCTHLGCLVDLAGGEIQCPCHGSNYDIHGRNLSGPALRPLAHLALSRNGRGDLVIDPNTIVDMDTRLVLTA
jgi:cytochrome b6-f complex iron-sulfur subunit